ncbi:MAG TPA: DUF3567 domain-containing protein [Burkholderiaceae bacterium]|nr:DUF3567 domain-containing protein [Burkholderiaceae bacterium]
MQMLYNSENFAVVQFNVPAELENKAVGVEVLTRGGYEIVDKFARKEIFIDGALAEHFKQGVEALIRTDPTEEEMDTYVEGFAALAQQPVLLH